MFPHCDHETTPPILRRNKLDTWTHWTEEEFLRALASVTDPLGRSVLSALYWPQSARGQQCALQQAMLDCIIPELERQASSLHNAAIQRQIRIAMMKWSRRWPSTEQTQANQQAEQQLCEIRAQTWPRNTIENLAQLVQTAVSELRTLQADRSLTSRADALHLKPAQPHCARSEQLKLRAWCDRQRALSLHCDPAGYSRRWKAVYEWIFSKLLHAWHESSQYLGEESSKH